jgi:hypothetical protein
MSSATTRRRLSVIAGYLWLALAAQLFLIAMLFAVVSPAALMYAILGIAAMAVAGLLFIRPDAVSVLVPSTVAGSLSASVGLMAVSVWVFSHWESLSPTRWSRL